MKLNSFSALLMVLLTITLLQAQSDHSGANTLNNVRVAVWEQGGDSIITCILSFMGTPPQYTYDFSSVRKDAVFRFPNTGIGGGLLTDGSVGRQAGPLQSVDFQYDNRESNGAVNVRLSFDPAPRYRRDLEIKQEDNTIQLTLVWPKQETVRNKLYITKKKRPGLAVLLIASSCIVLGAAALLIYKGTD